jgi:dipeptidyl aminopeptidase/acylaminoacyl peptidase
MVPALRLVVLYLAVSLVGSAFLGESTLHPGRTHTAEIAHHTAETLNAANTPIDVSIQSNDGATLRAWFLRPSEPSADTVLLLHGLGDNRAGMLGYAQLLLRHHYSVLLPDARAHGLSDGLLATFGLLESDDIHRWAEWLHNQEDQQEVRKTPQQKSPCIFAFGASMGAAQVLQSLATHSDFCAIVAESPFASFREIGYDRMGQQFHTGPWVGRTLLRPLVEFTLLYVRARYKLDMDTISPEEAVAHTGIPVLLIHGAIDSNIPLRHSEQIFASSHAQKDLNHLDLWVVPGADHLGAYGQQPAEFERRVTTWFENHGNAPDGLKRSQEDLSFRTQ